MGTDGITQRRPRGRAQELTRAQMTHSAIVHSVAPKEIGRRRLPPVLRLVALSRFPEDGTGWPNGAWSVELLFEQPPSEQEHNISEAKVQFAFDGAPAERLRPGALSCAELMLTNSASRKLRSSEKNPPQ